MKLRSRCAAGYGIASVVLALSTTASAQEKTNIDTERFKPAVTHDGWVNAEGSGVRTTQDPWEFGLFLNYQINPLVTVDRDGNLLDKYESGRLGFDLLASVTLADPFAIGLDLPFFLIQTGDADPSFAGLGDLRLVPKLRILDDRESIGLALAAELRLPTHAGDFSGGARNVTVVPKAILDHRFLNGIRIGFNLGVAVREETQFHNIKAGSEFAYAAALGYRIGGNDGQVELGGELNGGVGLSETDKEELPLEGFLYARYNPDDEWEFQAGPGFGIIAGYGVPIFRVFAGVRYTPTAHDADHDGIPDDEDQCPNDPEDLDHEDDADGCPEEDKDTDQDGVPDKTDECPDAKETINGVNDDDGCPDSGDKRVVYEDGNFEILDNVQFETGSAEISPESHSLLDQVALTVKANPQIKKLRVEGHTDERGDADMNMRLSKARAQAVRRYLVHKGVDPKRLDAEGYGETKPLESGTSPEALKKNRRVAFVVVSEE